MSTIALSQRHSKNPDEVREMLNQLAEKLDQRYDLKSRWLSDSQLELQRSGVKGRLTLTGSEVKVEIKLGMLMSPFKSKIQDEISRAMAEKLA
ncbi:polyhydroxyalkanoic acid system protein [Spongiibacter sp. KMU-166]|uniref:Polyhydroxyalkanoic acid system protein n=1 Tax=Spongiibacter thalassae TaxID=2721624 RepID=A0ABX1GFA9_9GAMM|nr:polyhydroxyalkanoic acid system family protein [Spongiibacter thalassae]NKI17182.1 polyhydroxyalkanoic acid system protein [Spongiibacter thalassae]